MHIVCVIIAATVIFSQCDERNITFESWKKQRCTTDCEIFVVKSCAPSRCFYVLAPRICISGPSSLSFPRGGFSPMKNFITEIIGTTGKIYRKFSRAKAREYIIARPFIPLVFVHYVWETYNVSFEETGIFRAAFFRARTQESHYKFQRPSYSNTLPYLNPRQVFSLAI